ncbi:MAG: c-type cytochrome, partial [Desulfobacterales bacterium]|nr:c-type cytochrome [Desulfobacterales bacterium]
MKNRRIQTGNISRLVLLGLLVFSWAFISACSSEKKWKDYQKAYAQKAAELGSKAPQKPSGVRVLEVAELGIQDRCTSCHVAMDDLTMLKEENPLKSHPASYLKEHPPARFGCTICHGGQGDSLSPEKAHGGTFSKGGLIQISCAKCHGEVVLEGAGNVNRGKLLLKRYQCINCHLIADLPEGEDFRPAPSLKGIGDKVGEKWLWRWLKEPKSYLPNATMPHYPMEEKYMDALVGYLMGSKNPRLKAEIQYPEGDSERGVGTLRLSFCSACHSFKGKGGQDGPDLGKIGNKVNQKWLTQMLADPHAFQPDTTMPRYNYTPQQISDVAAHLFEEFADFEMQEKDNAFKQPLFWKSPGERAEIGRRVYKEMRCANCHGILEEDGWWRKIGPDLTRIGEKPVSDINFGNSQVP